MKLIDKAELKNKTKKNYKKEERTRKEYFINEKYNLKRIKNSRSNYVLRKQFKILKNIIQMITLLKENDEKKI